MQNCYNIKVAVRWHLVSIKTFLHTCPIRQVVTKTYILNGIEACPKKKDGMSKRKPLNYRLLTFQSHFKNVAGTNTFEIPHLLIRQACDGNLLVRPILFLVLDNRISVIFEHCDDFKITLISFFNACVYWNNWDSTLQCFFGENIGPFKWMHLMKSLGLYILFWNNIVCWFCTQKSLQTLGNRYHNGMPYFGYGNECNYVHIYIVWAH